MAEAAHTELHRIAITGIIWRKGANGYEYLITKRSEEKKAFPGKWTVPGGGLEVDDYVNTPPTHAGEQWYNTVEKTLLREIEEEVGLEVSNVTYLLDLTFIRPDCIPVLVLSYFCRHESGEVTLDEDSVEYAWVSAKDAKAYDLIEGIEEELDLVEKQLSET